MTSNQSFPLQVLTLSQLLIEALFTPWGSQGSTIISPSKYISYPDFVSGIVPTLLCFELALVSIMHLWAYRYKPYRIKDKLESRLVQPQLSNDEVEPYKGGFCGILALLDALNPWDILKSIARSFHWLFVGLKHRHEDDSYDLAASYRDFSTSAGYQRMDEPEST